eukprot:GFKZ01002484.1.p2 GENE.GFKZ01002484.1~~GFKZ01002484.1.p2  ORF type:complete len:250 (-),score=22.78 GFKZ01002484.1:1123-1872(-)
MGSTQRGSTAWMRHQVVRDRIWRVIDAREQILGRLAAQIAKILQGRHKPMYMSNMDCGDPVIVINARHISLTGRKRVNKIYAHHSGYPGGRKEVPFLTVMDKRPEDPIRLAVKRMLPANRLRDVWLSNLRIYQDDEHEHEAQHPVPVPPASIGVRLGTGGPPTYDELNYWWVEHLTHVPDKIMKDVITEVRTENGNTEKEHRKFVGLAEALALPEGHTFTTAETDSHARYVTAVENSLKENAIILPTCS